jgi:hypothetical protein
MFAVNEMEDEGFESNSAILDDVEARFYGNPFDKKAISPEYFESCNKNLSQYSNNQSRPCELRHPKRQT